MALPTQPFDILWGKMQSKFCSESGTSIETIADACSDKDALRLHKNGDGIVQADSDCVESAFVESVISMVCKSPTLDERVECAVTVKAHDRRQFRATNWLKFYGVVQKSEESIVNMKLQSLAGFSANVAC